MDLSKIDPMYIDPLTGGIWFGFEVFLWVMILLPFIAIVAILWRMAKK